MNEMQDFARTWNICKCTSPFEYPFPQMWAFVAVRHVQYQLPIWRPERWNTFTCTINACWTCSPALAPQHVQGWLGPQRLKQTQLSSAVRKLDWVCGDAYGDSWKHPEDGVEQNINVQDKGKGVEPLRVAVSFPSGASCHMTGMHMTLSQTQSGHQDCQLNLDVNGYSGAPELTEALRARMTPVVSYWSSADMLWMAGKGQDGQGPCAEDAEKNCAMHQLFLILYRGHTRKRDVQPC